ncbi:MAG: type II toxin-antitoxin system VapC family toxin [Rhizobiaceae bacterium]|nr:type II toxin-antitoxin system VapC family toxin [Rhizobiaceae bacterium]
MNIWEIAIKSGLGKTGFETDPEMILREAETLGFIEQRVTSRQTILAGTLPLHHRDPFDRLLIAQAILEPARLVTADRTLVQSSELVDLI